MARPKIKHLLEILHVETSNVFLFRNVRVIWKYLDLIALLLITRILYNNKIIFPSDDLMIEIDLLIINM